jgi:hypothetical protein
MNSYSGKYIDQMYGFRKALYATIPEYKKWLNSKGVYYGGNVL